MGRLVVSTYVSLDGVVEDPGGADDFAHGWSVPFFDDDAACARVRPAGFAERMNSVPKYVASTGLTSLDEAEWNATVLVGDVVEQVARRRRSTRDRVPRAGRRRSVEMANPAAAQWLTSWRSRATPPSRFRSRSVPS